MAEILKVRMHFKSDDGHLQSVANCWQIHRKFILLLKDPQSNILKVIIKALSSPQLALLGAHYSYGKKIMIRNRNVIG